MDSLIDKIESKIENLIDRISPEKLCLIAIILSILLLHFKISSTYFMISHKYVVSQGSNTYTGRIIRHSTGLTVITEDGRWVVLRDIYGPIEMRLKEVK